jgi:hypothetical protein
MIQCGSIFLQSDFFSMEKKDESLYHPFSSWPSPAFMLGASGSMAVLFPLSVAPPQSWTYGTL